MVPAQVTAGTLEDCRGVVTIVAVVTVEAIVSVVIVVLVVSVICSDCSVCPSVCSPVYLALSTESWPMASLSL